MGFEEAAYTFVKTNRSSFYLRDKVSDEGDVGVEFLQTLADVTDHGQDVATAQQVDHPVQQSLLQLQLRKRRQSASRSEKGKSGTKIKK